MIVVSSLLVLSIEQLVLSREFLAFDPFPFKGAEHIFEVGLKP